MYFHGGKFESGSGSQPEYNGAVLAAQGDVIIVTVNYRLGVFGFFHSGKEGDKHGM